MELTTALNARRSIRSYTGEPIPEEVLNKILAAANAAPVGMGKYETVRLTVVTDKALLEEIEANTSAVFDVHDRSFLYGAPQLIVVSTTGTDNVSCSNAAMVTHNMALAAVDCGAGACCIWGCIRAMVQNPALVEKLHLPAGFAPSCALAVGLSQEHYAPRQIPADRIAVEYI